MCVYVGYLVFEVDQFLSECVTWSETHRTLVLVASIDGPLGRLLGSGVMKMFFSSEWPRAAEARRDEYLFALERRCLVAAGWRSRFTQFVSNPLNPRWIHLQGLFCLSGNARQVP